MGFEGLHWIYVIQDRNTWQDFFECGNEFSCVIKRSKFQN